MTATTFGAPDQSAWPLAPADGVVEVRPGDDDAMLLVEGWFAAYRETGDLAVRERIVLAYLGLADRLADRFRGSTAIPLEDLRQVGRLGLIRAVDRYEPDRATPFVPYAVACVVGEIKRHLRDVSWRLRVPRDVKELALRVCRAAEVLPQRLGHSPTTAELAEHLGTDEESVLDALAVARTRMLPSLDEPAGADGDLVLGDLVSDRGPREDPDDLLVLPELLRGLPDRERDIVRLHYAQNLNQYEIAERMGISQMHVSRLLRQAIGRLRDQLVEEP